MSNVAINIAAEFTGKKAFKQAETSTDKLVKNTKRLAASIGLAFSTRAIVNFGRLAVKASLDQQAEQNRLNQLLKVGVGATTQEIALLNDQAAALEKIGVVARRKHNPDTISARYL
jgi:cell division protein FtsB